MLYGLSGLIPLCAALATAAGKAKPFPARVLYQEENS
jgi:hypothetical protein